MTVGIPFGNYRLQRRIARGGMAEVFLAAQQGPEGFQRKVAVKRILPHLADVPQFRDMFMDEARLAARLSHPNIAHIYEFGSFRDNYFIAMEYIDGVDLGALLVEGASMPLPLEHVARVVAEVCAALNYAHGLSDEDGSHLNLVHRDISPQNIMVSFDGAVKILDFGIAKAAHHVERTQPGVVRGKFSYMSPEQVVGHKLDGRSDLFCAGIVLHELCCVAPLFPRTDAVAAMQRIRKEPVPPALRDGLPVPEPLQRVLVRALEKDADDRYQTAADMQLDLEQFLLSHGKLSNSVLLGRFFTDNYRATKEQEAADAASEPLREAEVFSTAGIGGPQLPRVEIAGEAALPGGRGGGPPDATPLVEISPDDGAATDFELFPAGDGRLETDAGTLELEGKADTVPDGPDLHMMSTAAPKVVSTEEERRRPAGRRAWVLGGLFGVVLVGAGVSAGYLFTPATAPTPSPALPGEPRVAAPAGDHPDLRAPVADPLPPVEEPALAPMDASSPAAPGAVVSYRRPDAGAPEAAAPPPARPKPRTKPRPGPRARPRRFTGANPAQRRASAGKGSLSITTIPWTQVYLGGKLLGITPLAKVELPAGTHMLLLKNPDGIRRQVKVTVRAGQVARVKLDLRR